MFNSLKIEKDTFNGTQLSSGMTKQQRTVDTELQSCRPGVLRVTEIFQPANCAPACSPCLLPSRATWKSEPEETCCRSMFHSVALGLRPDKPPCAPLFPACQQPLPSSYPLGHPVRSANAKHASKAQTRHTDTEAVMLRHCQTVWIVWHPPPATAPISFQPPRLRSAAQFGATAATVSANLTT